MPILSCPPRPISIPFLRNKCKEISHPRGTLQTFPLWVSPIPDPFSPPHLRETFSLQKMKDATSSDFSLPPLTINPFSDFPLILGLPEYHAFRRIIPQRGLDHLLTSFPKLSPPLPSPLRQTGSSPPKADSSLSTDRDFLLRSLFSGAAPLDLHFR